jgi:hypothetical protein
VGHKVNEINTLYLLGGYVVRDLINLVEAVAGDHDFPARDPRTPSGKQYPELQEVAERLANEVCRQINAEARKIESKMPYKAQFILEEMIKILEDRV